MLPGADPGPGLPAGASTSPHTGASFSSSHQGTFFFLLVKAFQAESSAQFRQTHQPVRVSPLSLCREPHGSFLRHPFSTHLRNQMTQPLSLAHPRLRRQTTSQRTHSCSLVVSGPGALFQPVPMAKELRGKKSKADGSQLYQLSIPSRPREHGRSPAEPPMSLVAARSDVSCHLEELLPPIPAVPGTLRSSASRTVPANAWKQLGKSTWLHRLEDNHGNYLGGHVPTIQPTAVPSHLETKHFWRKVRKI